ncbi:hypothetical protein TNCV_1296131 [Trichonephila clavipes]|uniref:Uncharacterized protein n=1 Tax=Trichonephila clavipes TaxID=2585209 RepID=A0A8X6SHK3_TRICX|nr:hypothetical protein TNCV_1296131 [Trichonephila clavipes]
MSICFGKVVNLMRSPSVQFQSKLGTHLSTHRRDEKLSHPCPARDLNRGPVVEKRDTLLFGLINLTNPSL